MEMNLHTNRYLYKISKNFREIGKNQSISCPLYYRGVKQHRNRGDYNGKYQPLQLYCRVAADDY